MARAPAGSSARREAMAGFLALGLVHGVWAVSLSELKRVLGLSDAELGTVLTAAALIALVPNFFGGALLHRWGRPVFPVAMAASALSFVLLGALPTGVFLVVSITLFRVSIQVVNVCINAAALHHEQTSGERVMPTMHACFSLGGVPGPVLAGLALSQGGRLPWVYLALAALLLIFCLTLTNVSTGLKTEPDSRPRLIDREMLTSKPLMIMAVIVMLGAFGESAMYTWTAIFLRDELGAPVLVGAAGTSAFYAAMAAGRLGVGAAQRRLRRLTILSASGLVILLAMSLALSTGTVWVAVLGVLLTGLAFAVTVPIGYSLAGSLAAGRSASVAALVTTLNSVSSILVPITVGALAGATSLTAALGLVPLVGAVVGIGALVFSRSRMAAGLTD